jgi:hypothetical protein
MVEPKTDGIPDCPFIAQLELYVLAIAADLAGTRYSYSSTQKSRGGVILAKRLKPIDEVQSRFSPLPQCSQRDLGINFDRRLKVNSGQLASGYLQKPLPQVLDVLMRHPKPRRPRVAAKMGKQIPTLGKRCHDVELRDAARAPHTLLLA